MHATDRQPPAPEGFGGIFWIFLRLGLRAFGGPAAHLAYFRQEFVARRRWLDEGAYADLVALCQFLPGPASSQVGMALGLQRGGYAGAAAAWLGFTLPSALLMAALGVGLAQAGALPAAAQGAVQGLLALAVAVVAQAVWGMARTLTPDAPRRALALAVAALVLGWPTPWAQVLALTLAAALGMAGARAGLPTPAPRPGPHASEAPAPARVPGPLGARACGALFVALLLGLPLLARWGGPDGALALLDAFYRAGALVFGGGHVVLPLLQTQVSPAGWLQADAFLAGYGAAQALPGPLFSMAAFLGAARGPSPSGWLGAGLAVLAIFLPAFLLLAAALPSWARLRQQAWAQGALAGLNAAVVGLLLAALAHPVGTHGLRSLWDAALAAAAWLALTRGGQAPWRVALACAGLGAAHALALGPAAGQMTVYP